jgi:hypothetical protein
MSTPIMLNMVQLTMREGALTLKQPIAPPQNSVYDIVMGLKRFLAAENAEKFIFSTQDTEPEMKADLTEKALRWIEKSSYGVQSFFFSFETHALMYNNQAAEEKMMPVFAKKIEQLVNDIQHDKLNIRIKKKDNL